MKSINLKFSIKFKKFLNICEEVLKEVENIPQKEHQTLMLILEKYKLFYIYKHFFIDYPNKNLELPPYKIKEYISLYKQKIINIDEFSTLPFYYTKEEIIYYIYADNSINSSLTVPNTIKGIKEKIIPYNLSNSYSIRNLLLMPINEIDYQLMILDLQDKEELNNPIQKEAIKRDNSKLDNKLDKLVNLNNEKFLSLFEMHQLYKELINIKNKLQEIQLKEIEIIFEDYLKDGFNFYNPNKKNFIYEVIIVWKYIIKKNYLHMNWIELVDKTNNLLWDNKKLRSLINKTQKEINLINDLLTVSHNVS